MQKVIIIIIITIAIMLFAIAVTAQERPPIGGSHSNVTIAPPPIVTQYAPTMTATPTVLPTTLPTEQWYPTPDDVHDCLRCDMMRLVS